jgi:hypothetical protein
MLYSTAFVASAAPSILCASCCIHVPLRLESMAWGPNRSGE